MTTAIGALLHPRRLQIMQPPSQHAVWSDITEMESSLRQQPLQEFRAGQPEVSGNVSTLASLQLDLFASHAAGSNCIGLPQLFLMLFAGTNSEACSCKDDTGWG